jgi:hypothetical protein
MQEALGPISSTAKKRKREGGEKEGEREREKERERETFVQSPSWLVWKQNLNSVLTSDSTRYLDEWRVGSLGDRVWRILSGS